MDLIDLEKYPIDRSNKDLFEKLLTNVRNQLKEDGCSIIKNFVKSKEIKKLILEIDKVSSFAHRSFNKTNPYFSKDNKKYNLNHPTRRFYSRSNSFIQADNFDENSILRKVYNYTPFREFIRLSLETEKFFPYKDPLADVIVNVVEKGEGFPWHFDTNNFTVTLSIQNADIGGVFEYVPNLRNSNNESYDDVQKILDGDRSKVKTINLNKGDLQIFKGRYSLHRVTAVKGFKKRYVGIFSFVETPGMVGSPERTMQLYGKTLPIHYKNAGLRSDYLQD